MDFIKILILSAVSFIVLFILTKLLGYRQISQLSFFDYIVGITIGSIAAEMSTNIDLEWWKGILAMAVYFILCFAINFIVQKSLKLRGVIDGKPIILMQNGEISRESIKKAKIQINDLITAARVAGYFSLSEIDTAVMETTGSISFLPKPLSRPLNPKDFNFAPARSGMCIPLIVDGTVVEENLHKANTTQSKLNTILAQREVKAEEILLATMDESGTVEIFKKENQQ